VKNEVTIWLQAQAAEFHDVRIPKLEPRLNKCLDKAGDYAEKQLQVGIQSFSLNFDNKYFYKNLSFVSLLSGHPMYVNSRTGNL
jgi:hypothetical protein